MKDTREWLQKEFEYFEAEPPMDLWPEIEARMKEEKAGKKKWIPYFSIAASILVLFGIFWSLKMVDRDTASMIAEDNPIETATPSTSESSKDLNEATMAEAEVSEIIEEDENQVSSSEQSKASPIQEETKKNTIGKNMDRPMQLFADNQSINDEPEGNTSLEVTEETKETPQTLSNIDHTKSTVAILTANNYEDHIVNEANMIPTRTPEKIKRVGSTNKLDLNDLTLEHAVAFASTGLNKIVNTPIEITQKDTGGETVKTYSFRLGNFTITKKQHVKTIKTDRS